MDIYLKIIDFILVKEKCSGSIEVEPVLVEGDDVRLGEDVTLARWSIDDLVFQGNWFEADPRNVTTDFHIER
jgi:hypothetical protein